MEMLAVVVIDQRTEHLRAQPGVVATDNATRSSSGYYPAVNRHLQEYPRSRPRVRTYESKTAQLNFSATLRAAVGPSGEKMALTLRQPGSQLGHLPHLICFLLSYGVMMFAFALVARGWGPLHADMTEAWAWGK